MGAEAAAHSPPDARSSGAAANDALARGLMLMRASNLSVVRLQLAVERRDRACVLERIDDLAALDRKLRALVHELPVSAPGLDPIERALEEQSDILAREKLALVSGVIRRGSEPLPRIVPVGCRLENHGDPAIHGGTPNPVHSASAVTLLLGPERDEAGQDQTPSGRAALPTWTWIAAAAILLLVVAASWMVAASDTDLITRFLEISGG
ncbi:hypothetical protein [Allosphingosinicella deserti]|uniref:Uncharacterized protein n=1 Tax=Allosphingosinicella deserti TaxID=2116704 RepID=A0A2P7QJ38_9SPHN|nr:hypothetical protein [Sphingomonas deserti]PSJ37946.1 hypothetical protein C7I55_19755 [Sphingomonas deserti]